MEIETSGGAAQACIDGDVRTARFLLALTHGAGGGIEAPDLLAARAAAVSMGGVVARVLQPYRVRGARAPGAIPKQDAAWIEIAGALRELAPRVPFVQGGRSNGARLACRTAVATDARGVVALAFPLHPPGKPEQSRAGELRECGVPALVVNGARDPFGIPDAGDADEVVVIPGETHALKGHAGIITAAIKRWLPAVLAGLPEKG
jgi:predicted alpha/beta-hydrolase family hydrolase